MTNGVFGSTRMAALERIGMISSCLDMSQLLSQLSDHGRVTGFSHML
jgi:hypothetical protein